MYWNANSMLNKLSKLAIIELTFDFSLHHQSSFHNSTNSYFSIFITPSISSSVYSVIKPLINALTPLMADIIRTHRPLRFFTIGLEAVSIPAIRRCRWLQEYPPVQAQTLNLTSNSHRNIIRRYNISNCRFFNSPLPSPTTVAEEHPDSGRNATSRVSIDITIDV